MSDAERRTVVFTTVLLLAASLVRFAWEARPVPPILPPGPLPAELVAETRAAVEREERMATPLAPGERVDPNRAPDVELARLPGIGPALAGRIVENRDVNGPFRLPADLLRVSGIGPATLARIEPLLDLSSPPPSGGASGSGGLLGSRLPGPSTSAPAGRLDLNRAGEAELQALPGIGPALALRIVEHRRSVGRFRTTDDLLEVSGIGPSTLERLRPLVGAGP
jgi:competence ComEA-like helix-hairpin-helix protein